MAHSASSNSHPEIGTDAEQDLQDFNDILAEEIENDIPTDESNGQGAVGSSTDESNGQGAVGSPTDEGYGQGAIDSTNVATLDAGEQGHAPPEGAQVPAEVAQNAIEEIPQLEADSCPHDGATPPEMGLGTPPAAVDPDACQ